MGESAVFTASEQQDPALEINEPSDDELRSEEFSSGESAGSFENAVPAPRAPNIDFGESAKSDQQSGDELPDLDSAVSKIPEGTRLALKELFRAEFSEVRKIAKDELR